MKQKLLLLMLLLTAGAGVSDVKAQSVVIRTKDGAEITKNLNSLRKFTFSDSNVLLNYFIGSTESVSISTISKIYFKSGTTGSESIMVSKGAGTISIYPNPVHDKIYVQNAPDDYTDVVIYRIDGTTVLRAQISPGSESVNVSNLTNGLYLLKVNNQAFKLIRQ